MTVRWDREHLLPGDLSFLVLFMLGFDLAILCECEFIIRISLTAMVSEEGFDSIFVAIFIDY